MSFLEQCFKEAVLWHSKCNCRSSVPWRYWLVLWLFHFWSSFLRKPWKSSRRCPNSSSPCTPVRDQEEAPGFGLAQFQYLQQFGNEPTNRSARSLSFSLSLSSAFPVNKITRILKTWLCLTYLSDQSQGKSNMLTLILQMRTWSLTKCSQRFQWCGLPSETLNLRRAFSKIPHSSSH